MNTSLLRRAARTSEGGRVWLVKDGHVSAYLSRQYGSVYPAVMLSDRLRGGFGYPVHYIRRADDLPHIRCRVRLAVA